MSGRPDLCCSGPAWPDPPRYWAALCVVLVWAASLGWLAFRRLNQSDTALITAPGRRYILVALTQHPKGDDYLVELAKQVDDLLKPASTP